ncbi:hypothetical protein MMC26_003370 [Xylographa opegraphella]|nr:hypothetical protein [Xylographa opegraphella]
MYSQRPFSEFKDDVQELCKTLWPLSPIDDSTVQYLPGGASNRVVGLTIRSVLSPNTKSETTEPLHDLPNSTLQVHNTNPLEPPKLLSTVRKSTLQGLPSESAIDTNGVVETRYIISIPRFITDSILPGISILDYIRNHTSIPTPSIISYDLTSANAIQSPYTLQLRIPGEVLCTAYRRLNLAQKYAFVHQYAELLRSIQSVTSSVAGELGFVEGGCPEKAEVQVLHFRDVWAPDDPRNGAKNILEGQTILSMILMQIECHQKNSKSEFDGPLLERLSTIAKEMDQLGCLCGSPFVLEHGDLAPRNIMIQVNDDGLLKITGVLDWDGAMFAPRFESCVAPHWIWDWANDDHNDEPECYKVPKDPAMRILKDTFEALMGQEYCRLCYLPQYRLARKVFYFARVGLHLGWDVPKIEKLFSDWDLLRGKLAGQVSTRES